MRFTLLKIKALPPPHRRKPSSPNFRALLLPSPEILLDYFLVLETIHPLSCPFTSLCMRGKKPRQEAISLPFLQGPGETTNQNSDQIFQFFTQLATLWLDNTMSKHTNVLPLEFQMQRTTWSSATSAGIWSWACYKLKLKVWLSKRDPGWTVLSWGHPHSRSFSPSQKQQVLHPTYPDSFERPSDFLILEPKGREWLSENSGTGCMIIKQEVGMAGKNETFIYHVRRDVRKKAGWLTFKGEWLTEN